MDLTSGNIETEDICAAAPLPGRAGNQQQVSRAYTARCSPFDEENVLLVGAGSLTGTLLPTASRTDITSKSPLNGRYGSANSGGDWGVKLRLAGFDHLAIRGKAKRPVILYIDHGSVYLEEATYLWGEDTWFTVD